MIVPDGPMGGRAPLGIDTVDIEAFHIDQVIYDGSVIVLRCEVQCRHPRVILDLNIGAVCFELLHYHEVALERRIVDRCHI